MQSPAEVAEPRAPQGQAADGLPQVAKPSFEDIWHGGYREADPLDPLADSTFYHFGYASVMHVLYLACIRPYIHSDTKALEIGCGGGAWTKTMLAAEQVWCLDAKSAAENRFFEYLGHPQNVRYLQVSGADCSQLPDDHFDYLFSFGCLCHLPFDVVRDYIHGLFPKLKSGANAFVMVADYDKFNAMWHKRRQLSMVHRLARTQLGGRRYLPVKWLLRAASFLLSAMDNWSPPAWALLDKNESDVPRPARLYHAGIDNTCRELAKAGFRVVCPDLQLVHRDPIIHFVKD
jgi:hypothetical protein